MKLDLSALRYLSTEDFRVLTAIELGMRNHEIVPVDLIDSIAKLKRTSTSRVIANLLKHKLIEHSNIKYDGYSLNFLGYDFLAINTLMRRGILVKLGPKLGVGKESDVHICYVNAKNAESEFKANELSEEDYTKIKQEMLKQEEEKEEPITQQADDKLIQEEENNEDVDTMMNKFEEEVNILDVKCHIAIIKIARLGRTSFRAVKTKRDYVKNKSHYNWLYLSRLSAMNEYKFLSGLYQENYAVPRPYGQNRHVILMEYIPSYPLCRIDDLGDKEKAYNDLIGIITSLATKGLIHGDFNEFNILVRVVTQKIYFIDFPQMISIAHEDAEKYFLRDINCINKFFKKKFGITFDNNQVEFNDVAQSREDSLDIKLKAYGWEKAVGNKDDIEKEASDEDLDNLSDVNDEGLGDNDNDSLGDNIEDDLQFDKEDLLKEVSVSGFNTEKIEVTSHSIKMKVKKMLAKQNAPTSKGKSNRFKEKKKEKIDF